MSRLCDIPTEPGPSAAAPEQDAPLGWWFVLTVRGSCCWNKNSAPPTPKIKKKKKSQRLIFNLNGFGFCFQLSLLVLPLADGLKRFCRARCFLPEKVLVCCNQVTLILLLDKIKRRSSLSLPLQGIFPGPRVISGPFFALQPIFQHPFFLPGASPGTDGSSSVLSPEPAALEPPLQPTRCFPCTSGC